MDAGRVKGAQARKPASGAEVIRFELPGYIHATTNGLIRRNNWKQGKPRQVLAWEIKIAMKGQIPSQPIRHARITVERHSAGNPDPDNLSAKEILDILQPQSNKHRCGLGVIKSDGKKWITVALSSVRVSKSELQKTVVSIEPVDSL